MTIPAPAHTPGPWVAIGTDPAEGGDWFWIQAQPNFALPRFTKEIGTVNGSQSDPEQQANARLIAAAPALVAALQGLMDHCGHSMECGFYDPGEACDCGSDPAKAQARAALSLALGEQ